MNRRAATVLLLCAAFFWGAGNVANKTALDHVGPLTAVGLRCVVGAVVIAPLALREMRGVPWRDGAAGAIGLSLLFAIALAFQQMAYLGTSVTNVSFLVNTCTIMTPVVAWIVLKERPALRIVAAALITLGGAFFMAGGAFSMACLNRGDLACLVSAVFYAGWMVALGQHAISHRRPFATSFIQFGIAALLIVPASFGLETPRVGGIIGAWREILFLGVFSTGAAFALQTHAQQFVTSSTAAILVSAESLFGAAGAFLLLGERIPAPGVVGALLVLLGILIAATGGRGSAAILPERPAAPANFGGGAGADLIEFRSVRTLPPVGQPFPRARY